MQLVSRTSGLRWSGRRAETERPDRTSQSEIAAARNGAQAGAWARGNRDRANEWRTIGRGSDWSLPRSL